MTDGVLIRHSLQRSTARSLRHHLHLRHTRRCLRHLLSLRLSRWRIRHHTPRRPAIRQRRRLHGCATAISHHYHVRSQAHYSVYQAIWKGRLLATDSQWMRRRLLLTHSNHLDVIVQRGSRSRWTLRSNLLACFANASLALTQRPARVCRRHVIAVTLFERDPPCCTVVLSAGAAKCFAKTGSDATPFLYSPLRLPASVLPAIKPATAHDAGCALDNAKLSGTRAGR